MLPFLQINGFWYVITDWEPDLKNKQELHLRLLNRKENAWLRPELENALMDVWARLFPDDEAIKSGVKINKGEK